MCIFCKIVTGEIPSKKVYEDEDIIIIEDINPQAKTHFLAIPKKHITDLTDLNESDSLLIGKLIIKLGSFATDVGLKDGFRVVTNKGKFGCQSVGHLHFHLLGGQQLSEKMC